MTKTQHKRLKLLLSGICLTWAALAGWNLFLNVPEDSLLHHKSAIVKERMERCQGTFQQRYDCKEAIVIEAQRETFMNMLGRTGIVVVPALVLGLGGTMVLRRIPLDRPAAPLTTEAPLDWKARAQRHVSQNADGDQSSGLS